MKAMYSRVTNNDEASSQLMTGSVRSREGSFETVMGDRSGRTKTAVSALESVLNEFRRQKISYCYWKSSRRLHAVFGGDGDVDLLVARYDQHRAQSILLKRNFKLFPSVADRDHPAVVSFLGHDESSGRLVHIHVHFRLVVGERPLRNYRLPWEEAFLARAVFHPSLPIRIIDPAGEALLLVMRECLELRLADAVTLRRWKLVTRKFALDQAELVGRVEPGALRAIAAELLGEDLAELITEAFFHGPPLHRQRRLVRRVRAHAAAHRSYNGIEARMRSTSRTVLGIVGKLNVHYFRMPRLWNRRAPGGGCMVSIIGVDGSGKSTLVAAMREWLGSKVDVIPIYFGTGDGRPSLFLWPFKLMMPLAMRVLGRKPKPQCASHGPRSGSPPGLLYSVLLTVWAAVVALDKRKKLIAARRGTNRGLIVLTDRFPQDQSAGFNDGPLLSRLTAAPRWLRRFEATAYSLACRVPPDLVIKLIVTPETIARREPNMDPAVLRERIAALERLDFFGARVVSINAERPLKEVVRAVKREIWRSI
jgi:thymidylate kinase